MAFHDLHAELRWFDHLWPRLYMKTLSIVLLPSQCHKRHVIIEHKKKTLSIVPSRYNPHFFKICIVPKWQDYRESSLYMKRGRKLNKTNDITHHFIAQNQAVLL